MRLSRALMGLVALLLVRGASAGSRPAFAGLLSGRATAQAAAQHGQGQGQRSHGRRQQGQQLERRLSPRQRRLELLHGRQQRWHELPAAFALAGAPAYRAPPGRRWACAVPGAACKLPRWRQRFARLAIGMVEPDASDGPSDGPILILGAGWVGSRLARQLIEDGRQVYVTNRPYAGLERAKSPYFRPVPLPLSTPRLEFDYCVPATWASLPPPESIGGVVITFALSDDGASARFWEDYLCRARNAILYSSTSVYQVESPGQAVDEKSPIRRAGRAIAEQFMQERGATVLTVSGIFGEKFSPRGICTCLSTYTSSGGALNGRKRVNMVHVDDIIAATTRCLELPRRTERINVAGHHFALSELITHCKHPEIPDGPDLDLSSKVVRSQRLLEEVMPDGFDFKPAIPDYPTDVVRRAQEDGAQGSRADAPVGTPGEAGGKDQR